MICMADMLLSLTANDEVADCEKRDVISRMNLYIFIYTFICTRMNFYKIP